MNSLRVVALGVFVLAGLPVAASPQAPGLSPTGLQSVVRQAAIDLVYLPYVSSSGGGQPRALVADHTVISQFDSLTDAQISAASSQRVLFMHRSTGAQISAGLNCLQGVDPDPMCLPYPDYKYDRSNWNWPLFSSGTAPDLRIEFESTVNAQANNYDVFGMKFCFLDWWYQSFADYRDMMLRLESQYPNKKFIWATQVLWDDMNKSPDPSAIKTFNDQLRNYAQSNNKALYDLADMESHSASGAHCTQIIDGVVYEMLCSDWGIPGDGHLSAEGGVHLAKGFWWLMVKLQAAPTVTSAPPPSRTPASDGVVNIVRGGLRFR